MKLSAERIAYYKTQIVAEGQPCRFLHNGQALNIITGGLCSKGSNVIYHPTYWNFTRETAKKIAKELGVKVVFSAKE